MVESALRHIRILEAMDFRDIKVSLKAPDVARTCEAYRIMAETSNYPLHLGITEAGTPFYGTIKSSVGLGILLHQGIGDTIRVSLTGAPEEEVRVAYGILRATGVRQRGVELVSCPTCGRTRVNLIPVAMKLEQRLAHIDLPLKIAVMGCAVNGPGEAREADLGICGGKEGWLVFRQGEVIGRLDGEDVVEAFLKEIEAEAEKRRLKPGDNKGEIS
jgi:(E)-4-hydroxy-3-methylbut-2-enyl-diphosphate synthase